MGRRRAAVDVAQRREDGSVWIDHAILTLDDAEWLADVERLTLWNVAGSEGVLAGLLKLWWLDVRGGTASNIAHIGACVGLRYLQLNQIRQLWDLAPLAQLATLEYLSLYGLASVQTLPSLGECRRLIRLEIGQMRRLHGLGGALDAPSLEELVLVRRVHVADEDTQRIQSHPSLREFTWFAEDVPDRVWQPVTRAAGLPQAPPVSASEWFARREANEYRRKPYSDDE